MGLNNPGISLHVVQEYKLQKVPSSGTWMHKIKTSTELQLKLASGVFTKAKAILDLIIPSKILFSIWQHTTQNLKQYSPRCFCVVLWSGFTLHCCSAEKETLCVPAMMVSAAALLILWVSYQQLAVTHWPQSTPRQFSATCHHMNTGAYLSSNGSCFPNPAAIKWFADQVLQS